MNITQSEKAVLISIRDNHYGDGDCTWVHSINDSRTPSGITGKTLSGVVSSLQKKGLVSTDGESICVTWKGMQVVKI